MDTSILQMFSLAGNVAIVSGASRGIGHAIACGLALAGADVIAVARSPSPNHPFPGHVDYRVCDIEDAHAFQTLVDEAIAKHGHIDTLVNAAGISLPASAQRRFQKTVSMNLTAPYMCSLAVCDAMKTQGGGSIINITSLGSVLGFPDNPAYVASKGGLRALTKALANDFGPYGIRVNNLAPGYIHTDMTRQSHDNPEEHERRKRHTMLGRWGDPEDLVGAAIFLASRASAYITGQDIFVDGGWTAKGLT
ncbi:MAG: SDR family oxidoreductase [Alphaproteobacteria bacterium]|nr:SDR family oxidoreductase [Alphaproteobacteria bacterium]